jgi:putative ABC transport system permease protein
MSKLNLQGSRPLLRVAIRYILANPLQSLLMILGISLGVAVAVSVDVANASAEKAFQLSTEALNGRSTHYLSGGPTGLSEELYSQLRTSGLEIPIAPVINQRAISPQIPGQSLQLLGIDPFSETPFRNYLSGAGSLAAISLTEFLITRGAVLISEQLATNNDLDIGDQLILEINGISRMASIIGLLQTQDDTSASALENLILADIASAQEISGRLGVLDRVELILPDEETENIIEQINALLPEGVQLSSSLNRNQVTDQMTQAFRTNLTALSLLALLVGLFLIYNTMTFSIIQRRSNFGTLRALGVTRAEIFRVVIIEAIAVGAIGTLLGVALGVILGRGVIQIVAQTINDVFFTLSVKEASFSSINLVKGLILGLVASLLAAIAPAWEAAHSPPRRVLSRAHVEGLSNKLINIFALAGASLIVFSALALAGLDLGLVLSFGATFGVVIGFALLAPWLTMQAMPWASIILGRIFGVVGRMAPREVANSASRTSVAMAALMVAVAVTIGVSLMVASFRQSVVVWLDQILRHDIYVSVSGDSLGEPIVALDERLIESFGSWDGIEEQFLLRNVLVDSRIGPITVSANNNPNDGQEQVFISSQGSPAQAWELVKQGAVLLSEPLANRLNIGMGDEISLMTNLGEREFAIVGVFQDYSSSAGNVTMWLDNYRNHWDDQAVTAFSLKAAENVDLNMIILDLRQASSSIQQVDIRSTRDLRETSLIVFDRTFTITSALQIITTAVAFIGVLSSMLAIQVEKQRQLGIFKAIGMSARQLWSLIVLETGLIGLMAGILALPTGYAVALILVRVINVRSFGWTMNLFVEPEPFIQAVLISLFAGLLAGIYPAMRISKRKASDAMRFD